MRLLALLVLAASWAAPARAAGSISFEEGPPSPDAIRSQYCNGSAGSRGAEFLLAGRIYVPSVATASPTHAKPELCDVGGSAGCTISDAVIVRRALLGPPTAAIEPRCAPARP